MCTVTFIPQHNSNYILTSNRDESVARSKALTPELTQLDDVDVILPKDSSKGGTWIGTTNQGKTLCLLNGAFVKHTVTNDYVKSRGLVVLDFFKTNHSKSFIESYSLKGIEPFTLVIIDKGEVLSLLELKWDGNTKHVRQLNPNESHIWSSATLYNAEKANFKSTHFKSFVQNNPNANDILEFHENGTEELPELMKYINEASPIETISITQVISQNDNYTYFRYKDLLTKTISEKKIKIKEEVVTL